MRKPVPSTTANKKGPRKVKIDFGAPLPPTEKQLDFIAEIGPYVEVDFYGTTRDEASEYITQHIDGYREAKRADEEGSEYEGVFSPYGGR